MSVPEGLLLFIASNIETEIGVQTIGVVNNSTNFTKMILFNALALLRHKVRFPLMDLQFLNYKI